MTSDDFGCLPIAFSCLVACFYSLTQFLPNSPLISAYFKLVCAGSSLSGDAAEDKRLLSRSLAVVALKLDRIDLGYGAEHFVKRTSEVAAILIP